MVALVLVAAAACSEDALDKVSEDINHLPDVPPKYTLADVIASSAKNTGGDINTYTACYIEHEAGSFNQLYRAEMRSGEPSSSSTLNNAWNAIYSTLLNAKDVIDKCSDNSGLYFGNDVTQGMAEVMMAYNWALLTDMFGDVPFKEALNPDLTITPKVDKQEDIYNEIFRLLNSAIDHLGKKDKDAVGNYDLLYNGDAAKWIKFAKGLRARYTMRLMKVRTPDYAQVIADIDASFADASEQAAYAHYTGYNTNNLNPLCDFALNSRQGYFGASQSMHNKLEARNDPRDSTLFLNIDGDWEEMSVPTNLAPNGMVEHVESGYAYSVYYCCGTAPTYFLSYHELQFLKAEAQVRSSDVAGAQASLKEAVMAAMANSEASLLDAEWAYDADRRPVGLDTIAGDYFDNQVLPLFTAEPLKEVMVQKYIALWGANGESTEAYNDIRRLKGLGEDFITLENPKNTYSDGTNRFPLRLPYGNGDTTTNPNVKERFGDGSYVYSEPVWWAGGTR